MNEPEPNDALDRLLRDQATYIDDRGFTRRVLTALPRRRQSALRPAIVLGATALACALTVWGFPTDETVALARLDFPAINDASVSAVAAALIAIGSIVWRAVAALGVKV
jgi:hypothetical protein